MSKPEGNANRFKIALWCTIFNLLFEYSMRGINNLLKQPVLFPLLIGVYFTYFLAFEDLIVRFKLKETYAMAVAFFFGTFYIAFATGIVFVNPNFLGINVWSLLFVNVVWWGLLQAILTFYLANRITPRNWNHLFMGKTAWLLIIIYQSLMLVLFQFANPLVPKGTPIGYITISGIIIASFLICLMLIKKRGSNLIPVPPHEFKPSHVLDALAFGSAALFLILAVGFTGDPHQSGAHQINQLATSIAIWWSLILAAVMLIYRMHVNLPSQSDTQNSLVKGNEKGNVAQR